MGADTDFLSTGTEQKTRTETPFPIIFALCVGGAVFLGILGFTLSRHFHHKYPPSREAAHISAAMPQDYSGDSWQSEAQRRAETERFGSSANDAESFIQGSVFWADAQGNKVTVRADVPDKWFGEDLAGVNRKHNWVCLLTAETRTRWSGSLGETESYYPWQDDICDKFAAAASRTAETRPHRFTDLVSAFETERKQKSIENETDHKPAGIYRYVSKSHRTCSADDECVTVRTMKAENFRTASSNVLTAGLLAAFGIGFVMFLIALAFGCAADPRYHRKHYWD